MIGRKLAIIGAGPAGLSLARFLRDMGQNNITLYESSNRVGGKSESFYFEDTVVELGTCYATLYDRITKSWMRELGIELVQNGTASYDGADFMSFVKDAPGEPFFIQVMRFVAGGHSLRKRLAATRPSQATLDEAAQPIIEWVKARNLHKMERFLYRGLTGMGYGFIDQTPAIQAHRWCGFPLLLSGALNQLHAPATGWSQFWSALAEDFDVRTDQKVMAIERTATGVSVTTQEDTQQYDQIVCTIPVSDFANILQSTTPDEDFIAESIDWQSYTTTLIAVENWFNETHTQGWSKGTKPGATYGQLIAARHEAYEADLGGDLYVTGQLSKGLNRFELQETLTESIERLGGKVTNVIEQRVWRYFPMYQSDAIRAGLLQKMANIQGRNRTWYTGSSFSHEAVGPIVNFNAKLAKRIIKSEEQDHTPRPSTARQSQELESA